MSEVDIIQGRLGLGYNLQLIPHDKAALAAPGVNRPLGYMSLEGAPRTIEHKKWLEAISQINLGACAGHAMAADAEILNWIDTGGEIVRMSRMWCYLKGQQRSGFFGRDQGAGIAGCVDAAKLDGICREVTHPYPIDPRTGYAVYDMRFPPGAAEEAIEHRVKSSTLITPQMGYAGGFAYLASGVGVLDIGIDWTTGLANNRSGIIQDARDVGGNSLGGHSLSINGYSDRKDRQDRNFLWMLNSHGKGWGNQGWAEVSPSIFEWWLQCGAVIIGVSDLEEYAPRQLPLERIW